MTGVLLGLAVTGLGLVLWPDLHRAAPAPLHMLGSGAPWVEPAARALVQGARLLKLVAAPLVLTAAEQAGAQPPGLVALGAVLLVVTGVVGLLHRRRVRSCAAPMGEEALFFAGTTLAGLAATGAWPALPLGVALAMGLCATIGAAWFLTWGQRPAFIRMRQPNLRILGDNPDAYIVVGRALLRGDQLLRVPLVSEGPVSIALYDLRYTRLDELVWSQLEPIMRDTGEVRVHLGPTHRPDVADFSLAAPEGKVIVSIRQYRQDEAKLRPPTLSPLGAA